MTTEERKKEEWLREYLGEDICLTADDVCTCAMCGGYEVERHATPVSIGMLCCNCSEGNS